MNSFYSDFLLNCKLDSLAACELISKSYFFKWKLHRTCIRQFSVFLVYTTDFIAGRSPIIAEIKLMIQPNSECWTYWLKIYISFTVHSLFCSVSVRRCTDLAYNREMFTVYKNKADHSSRHLNLLATLSSCYPFQTYHQWSHVFTVCKLKFPILPSPKARNITQRCWYSNEWLLFPI